LILVYYILSYFSKPGAVHCCCSLQGAIPNKKFLQDDLQQPAAFGIVDERNKKSGMNIKIKHKINVDAYALNPKKSPFIRVRKT
jgi:hypothetical protein